MNIKLEPFLSGGQKAQIISKYENICQMDPKNDKK